MGGKPKQITQLGDPKPISKRDTIKETLITSTETRTISNSTP
jgi:hypothetical protein